MSLRFQGLDFYFGTFSTARKKDTTIMNTGKAKVFGVHKQTPS